ncbi:MAG: radical SAM protein [Acidimicrobiia bacterium]
MVERGMTELFTEMPPSHWCVTPYRLCDYRCVYCCTGAQGESIPVMSAAEAVDETRRRLREIPQPRYMILGAFSDAYPSVEGTHGITRAIVEELVRAGQKFGIVTKGESVLRDLDLLLAHGGRAFVQVSICSVDDAVLRKLDPGAPSGTARFAVIDELHRAGVRTGLNILPWIPDVTDTVALIARVPVDVEVTLGAWSFGKENTARRLLGRVFTRDEVVRRYLDEYRRLGHIQNTSWVRPPPPGTDNSARNRLPRLPAPSGDVRVGVRA